MSYKALYKFFITIVLLCIFSLSYGQKYSTTSKKAIKNFEKALALFDVANINEALLYIDKSLKAAPDFIEPCLLKSEIMIEKGEVHEAIEALGRVIKINENYDPRVFWRRGDLQLAIGKYAEAKKDYEKFLSFAFYKNKYDEQIAKRIVKANFGIQAVNNPIDFTPQNLGKNINTKYNEYWPSLTLDEKTLIFTALVPESNAISVDNKLQEDFYIAHKTDTGWTKALNMGQPTNTRTNEGAQTISADGNTLVFTACNRPDGQSCDLYVSYRMGGRWTLPRNMGEPINSSKWESQPSLSADGQTLYFVSNRGGGLGGKDIWVSKINGNGQWENPHNAGKLINTEADETSPFIHPDNATLYFASDGHIGMGGSDIFLSRTDDDRAWTTPKNLGYPINTYKNETALTVNTKGQLAYISSDREGGYGGLDLYSFPLAPEIQASPLAFVKGYVYDANTKQPLSAKLKLVNIKSEKGLSETFSNNRTGDFLLTMPLANDFALYVEKEGYLFFSENYNLSDLELKNEEVKSYSVKVPLKPIEKGMSVILKNIFFETDSYVLKPASNVELNKLYQFLFLNKTLKVEIGGHTDNVGSKEHNKELSANRAKTVYTFLIDKGIGAQRLSYAGYGYDKPIAENDTEQGRALNRRTEFVIVGSE